MKIYKCKKCKAYTKRVHIKIPLVVAARINDSGEFWLDDPDFEIPWSRKIYEPIDVDMFCEECGMHELELIDVDECPHEWGQARYHAATLPPYRRCRICKAKRDVEISWRKK